MKNNKKAPERDSLLPTQRLSVTRGRRADLFAYLSAPIAKSHDNKKGQKS